MESWHDEDEEMQLGRRKSDSLQVVNTDGVLTTEELAELKRLASLSKQTRMIVVALMAITSLVGFPAMIEWMHKHISW